MPGMGRVGGRVALAHSSRDLCVRGHLLGGAGGEQQAQPALSKASSQSPAPPSRRAPAGPCCGVQGGGLSPPPTNLGRGVPACLMTGPL